MASCVAPFALRYRRAGEARWLRYLSPNGVVGETPFGETPFALSLSKGSYRSGTVPRASTGSARAGYERRKVKGHPGEVHTGGGPNRNTC